MGKSGSRAQGVKLRSKRLGWVGVSDHKSEIGRRYVLSAESLKHILCFSMPTVLGQLRKK